MNRRFELSRRQILRATGAGAGLLPLFGGRGDAADYPRRLIQFITFNGTVQDEWNPTGTETDFNFGRILQPLDPFKKDVVVVAGLRNKLSDSVKDGGDPTLDAFKACHGHTTWLHILTGRLADATAPNAYTAGGGPSLDQFIVKRLNPPTKFASLQLGVMHLNETNPVVWADRGRPLHADSDTVATFGRLFGSFTAPPDTLKRLRLQRRSVLDLSAQRLQALVAQQLGADAQQKLAAHLQAVRTVEKGLDAPAMGGCKPPAAPMVNATGPGSPVSFDGASTSVNAPVVAKAQIDNAVAAMACDLTRFVTIQMFTGGQGGLRPGAWLGFGDDDAHAIAHDSAGPSKEKKILFERWHAEQLAYLLGQMKAVPEGSGTMLDHSIVLSVNIMSHGTHVPNPPPFLLAGGGGGWKTGRFLTYGDIRTRAPATPAAVPHNNLLVSICRAMGVPVDTFGDAQYCTGPLARLA